jgi:hypothetical protein
MNKFEDRMSRIIQTEQKPKWPKLKRDYDGLLVKVIKTLKNGYVEVPAGTICKITNAHGGLDLISMPCPSCGIKVIIRKVHQSYVELIGR